MAELLQLLITGLAVGMVYALIALGFVVVWKSSSVANLALGQLVLFSSWFTYGMLVQANFPLWLGFLLVIPFALVLGWLIERFALRPLIAQPILSLITVTLGVAYFIEGIVTFIWPKSVAGLPRLFPIEPFHLGNAVVSQEYVWVAAISLVVFLNIHLYGVIQNMGVAFVSPDVFRVIESPLKGHRRFVKMVNIRKHGGRISLVPQDFRQQDVRRFQTLPPPEGECIAAREKCRAGGNRGKPFGVTVIKQSAF